MVRVSVVLPRTSLCGASNCRSSGCSHMRPFARSHRTTLHPHVHICVHPQRFTMIGAVTERFGNNTVFVITRMVVSGLLSSAREVAAEAGARSSVSADGSVLDLEAVRRSPTHGQGCKAKKKTVLSLEPCRSNSENFRHSSSH